MAFLKSLTLDNLCKLQMEIGWLGTDRMSLIEETESEVERRKGLWEVTKVPAHLGLIGFECSPGPRDQCGLICILSN